MESLTGPIPDDWSITSLGEVCEIEAGSSLVDRAARSAPQPAIRVITAKNIVGHELNTGREVSSGGEIPRRLERYRLAAGDLVFARAGRLGRVALVGAEHENWLVGSGCIRLRVRRGLDPRYLLYYLGHPAVADWLSRSAMGSVIPTHSLRNLKALPVALPPMDAQEEIIGMLGVINEKIAVHQEIVRSTAELRDRLLRLLLAGGLTSPERPPADGS